jgi:hypothetical protein
MPALFLLRIVDSSTKARELRSFAARSDSIRLIAPHIPAKKTEAKKTMPYLALGFACKLGKADTPLNKFASAMPAAGRYDHWGPGHRPEGFENLPKIAAKGAADGFKFAEADNSPCLAATGSRRPS